jgi:hypothetical protein
MIATMGLILAQATPGASAPATAAVPPSPPADPVIAGSAPWVMWATIIVFNLAVLFLLRLALAKIDWNSALEEKKILYASFWTTGEPSEKPFSYSRAIGTIGGIVLAGFFWGICNVTLYKAFLDYTQVMPLVKGVGPLFLAGSALFLPYAFNQLSAIFIPIPTKPTNR